MELKGNAATTVRLRQAPSGKGFHRHDFEKEKLDIELEKIKFEREKFQLEREKIQLERERIPLEMRKLDLEEARLSHSKKTATSDAPASHG